MTATPNILLVDDREDNLFVLEQLLKSHDARIHTARSGMEALELLRNHSFAVALLDVWMPGMDGYELAELMRGSERTRDIPILFITGGDPDHARLFQGYDLGAVDFLVKPIEPRLLDNKIRTFLRLYRQNQELAEAKHRLEALMDAAPVEISFSQDRSCLAVKGNPALLRQFDLSPGDNASASANEPEAAGRQIRYLAGGRELSADELPLQRAAHEGRIIGPLEFEVQLPSGRSWHAEGAAAPLRNDEGRLVGSVCVISDITRRKRLEEALRASESRFRGTFQNAAVGFAHVDDRGRFLRVNRALGRITGYSEEELLKKTLADITHPDDFDASWEQVLRLKAGELDHFTQEMRYVQKDGAAVWVSLTVSRAAEGPVSRPYFIGVIEDIQARKTAEAALRHSEQRLQAMADSMPQLVWTAEASGVVDYYNARASEYMGLEQAKDGSWPWQPIVHPDDLEHTRATWRAATASEHPYACEHRLRMADGSYRWHLSRANLVREPASGQAKWFGTATDIHDRKQAEQRLRDNETRLAVALDAAERALRARDQLVALVSHDLRNPLGAIMMQVAYLRMQLAEEADTLTTEQLDSGLARIERQATRMTSLISELLDVEVLKAGQTLALQRRETDLVALTRQLTEDHQRISPNHRIELLSRTATLTGKWDPERIERVIQNLLANAVKYSPNGGQVLVEIEPYTHESCDCAIVRVTDSGMGIPKKDHTRIFEWFARGGNIEGTGIRGTGIGLASAKQIIEQHGGAISVESQEGKGSTFTIRIPISPSPPAKTAISEHAKPETGELCASN